MELTPNHITIGNDSAGVIVNSAIIWKKGIDIQNHSTWLMSYSYPPGYASSNYYIINGIRNDTLEIADNANDGIGYVYTRFR